MGHPAEMEEGKLTHHDAFLMRCASVFELSRLEDVLALGPSLWTCLAAGCMSYEPTQSLPSLDAAQSHAFNSAKLFLIRFWQACALQPS